MVLCHPPMLVRCDRCETEYDFDEALLSARGTSVKCTECSNTFKVHVETETEDRWRLTSNDGTTRVFTSLASLQHAILHGELHIDDMLRRGTSPPKRLGDMVELTAFFARGSSAPTDADPLLPRPTGHPSSRLIQLAGPLRAHETSLPDIEEVDPPPTRHSVGGGSIVLLVGLGVALGGGFLWFAKQTKAPPAAFTPAASMDHSAALAHAETALLASNTEEARRVLATVPPDHTLGKQLLWRIENTEADLLWLQARVAENDGERARLMIELGKHAKALEMFLSGGDPTGANRVDSLRLLGRATEAQGALGALDRSNPNANYAAAAVDALAPEPPWVTVVDRMRTAAALETSPGRARAFLVYALATSQDTASAQVELQRTKDLDAALWRGLRRYVARIEESAAAQPLDAGTRVDGHGYADPRQLTADGSRALARGDMEGAGAAFEAALARNPQDSEALAGLADIERARHRLPQAQALYRRTLQVNPTFLPALISAADVDWELGERTSAERQYRDIVNRFPESAYPARVKERAEPRAVAESVQGSSAAPPADPPSSEPLTTPSSSSTDDSRKVP